MTCLRQTKTNRHLVNFIDREQKEAIKNGGKLHRKVDNIKRKALERDVAKCAKLSDFFLKTSESETPYEVDETALQQQPLAGPVANTENEETLAYQAQAMHPQLQSGQKKDIMSDRFNCKNCNESLCGRKYIQVEDNPHCIPCYDRLYANTCQECKEIIGHNAKELFYENRHYHAHCFRCFHCDRSLADEPFTSQEDALVCSDCYCSEYSSKCVSCDKIVMPGSRLLEYGGSTWHEDCFMCHGCEKPIGAEAFIPDNNNYYCVPCYEGRVAPQCSHCKKALTKGGVTYKDEVWHKECFLCTGCKAPLAGQPFTSQGESPYCVKCFSSLYAKKCAGCNTAITGFGDGKYVSFEDRQWHQPCFKCSRCSVSLVGSGFFPDRDKILCTDCNNDD